MKKESKGLSLLKNLDLAIAGVLLVALIFLTFFGVARRYLFGKPLIWMEEFQGLLFLWITFLGAGAAFRYGSHVKIDMVLDALHGTARKVVEIIDESIIVVLFDNGSKKTLLSSHPMIKRLPKPGAEA